MIFPLPRLHSLRRLFLPLVASIVFHAAIFWLAILHIAPRPTPRIEVRLPQLPESLTDTLLKNTLKNTLGQKTNARSQAGIGRSMAQAQQQRLAKHVFYPPQAVEQGMEGEVRLLLRLDAQGRLLEARVASSSGHDLLDQAAVAAAYATRVFPGSGSELILPVVFSLSE